MKWDDGECSNTETGDNNKTAASRRAKHSRPWGFSVRISLGNAAHTRRHDHASNTGEPKSRAKILPASSSLLRHCPAHTTAKTDDRSTPKKFIFGGGGVERRTHVTRQQKKKKNERKKRNEILGYRSRIVRRLEHSYQNRLFKRMQTTNRYPFFDSNKLCLSSSFLLGSFLKVRRPC